MLDLMAERYGVRPSSFLAIDNEWAAFDFDLTVFVLGSEERERQIKNAKDGKSNKPKQRGKISDLLKMPGVVKK